MILALLGSRDPRGRTAQAADALLQGAAGNGASVERVFLTGRHLERCRQCDDDGWGQCRREGRCVIEDELHPLIEQLRRARALVLATPVYFSGLSESTGAFLDRLRRVCANDAARADRLAGKPAVGICVAGGGGGGAPACTVALERVLLDCGLDVRDVVPARRQNLGMKKRVLRVVGRWVASF